MYCRQTIPHGGRDNHNERDDVTTVDFNKHADGYDVQWARLAPMINGLHLIVGSIFMALPDDARILVIGAGTGAEILYLAERYPRWRFTAVDPAAQMLDVLRRRADERGILDRCELHHGYVDSLPRSESYDAATSILVSQFVLDPDARRDFFRAIGERLKPGGLLASADLAADMTSEEFTRTLEIWGRIMTAADVSPEGLERMRAGYGRDVAVIAPERVAAIIASAGFEPPVQFFQAALIHAWYSRWSPGDITQ